MANTRLRLVRRLIFASIVLIGIMLALSQFEEVKRVATGLLASSAVLGLVVGFAARQTLANGVAGMLLAITQPIRIGDLVTFEGESGTVEDVRLTYTFIRKSNDTAGDRAERAARAEHDREPHDRGPARARRGRGLAPPHADTIARASGACRGAGMEVEIAEIDKDGVKLTVATRAESARERGAVAAGSGRPPSKNSGVKV